MEVKDPRLLAVSNVWLGQFLDHSRSPLNEAPTGLKSYEVSFYLKVEENDVRKIVLSASANRFDFLCPTSNRVRSIELDTDHFEVSNTFVKFPWPRTCGVSDGFRSPNGKLAVVRGDGAIYEMDTATQEFSATAVSGSGDCNRIVYPVAWPRSQDGTKVYVGYGPATPDGMATSVELRVFDTSNWKQVGSVTTSIPFWSASMSHDGTFVYAVVPEEHRVLVMDAASLRETGAISVGRAPALALVAP